MSGAFEGGGAGYPHAPVVAAHVGFRAAAAAAYLLCGVAGGGFVLHFVAVVLLLAVDFWTVKNVSGRILVGLRWWNRVRALGETETHTQRERQREGERQTERGKVVIMI
jgi:hypothetical protein